MRSIHLIFNAGVLFETKLSEHKSYIYRVNIWILLKIIAGLAVVGVVIFTAMLTYHIVVRPLGGVFEKIIPEAGTLLRVIPEQDFAKMLEASEMPDFEPGEKAFQKAHELIALGQIAQGREKLLAIVNVFPSSPAAPTARNIVGEMNLDEILSSEFMDGKSKYEVKRGDSYFAIAEKNHTSMDMLIHLNGMMDLKNLQPGDELLLMPLDFRVLIEPARKSISLWKDAVFICEYPILNMDGVKLNSGKTTIHSRRATINEKSVSAMARDYRATAKSLSLASSTTQILPFDESDETASNAIYLSAPDIEELFLLTRTGNPVEIRNPKK